MELLNESINLSNSEIRKQIKKQIKPDHRTIRDPSNPKYYKLYGDTAASDIIEYIMDSNAPLKVKSILLRDWRKINSVSTGPDFLRKAYFFIETHKKWLVYYGIHNKMVHNFSNLYHT